jgi:mannose-6-phosphate isomerase
MYRLENRVKDYAWGSKTAIADLLGLSSPSLGPEAELWMGAHPSAPSRALVGDRWRSLLDIIESAPAAELGEAVAAHYGPRLPFLFKVLAAEAPLSLQAHPSAEQARLGFAREERTNIARDAPHRNYKDDSHKPELIVALGPFEALSGFRRARDTLRLLSELAVREMAPGVAALEREPDARGTKALFTWLMGLVGDARARLVEATLTACRALAERHGAFAAECAWALRLGEAYPGDAGIAVSLMLNLVVLEEGQAIYLPAGNMHAYLRGVGLEIMANSDNVLRGGLTPKHVDVPELLSVLTFADGPVDVLTPDDAGTERVYATPAPEFRLSRIDVGEGHGFRASSRNGAEILLCVAGTVDARARSEAMTLGRGQSLFVPALDGGYEITGQGRVFRATVGASR